ncbi:MAG: OmpA family protein [Holosporaceae bacterium]|nr:OmpA family protein [Holosporaceae bacterium]
MNKVKKSFFFASLVLLTACECGKKESKTAGIIVDDSTGGSAADFIANAGDRVFFAFDKSNLSPEAKATLLRQAEWLNKYPDRKILIEGHCDERGTREYNLGLGERRADAAAKNLLGDGVSGDRVRTISYGKDKPIAAQGTAEEIHQLNRVAVTVLD